MGSRAVAGLFLATHGGFRVTPHGNLRGDVGLSFLQKNKL